MNIKQISYKGDGATEICLAGNKFFPAGIIELLVTIEEEITPSKVILADADEGNCVSFPDATLPINDKNVEYVVAFVDSGKTEKIDDAVNFKFESKCS